jgi:hypothetical protein
MNSTSNHDLVLENSAAELERIVFVIGYLEGEPKLTAVSPNGNQFTVGNPMVEVTYGGDTISHSTT